MSIWSTRNPTTSDYPIWAYTEDINDVVLIKSPKDLPFGSITWRKAYIPTAPDKVMVKFQQILQNNGTAVWTAIDWFRAGYEYGTKPNGSQDNKVAKSPFVDPEEYWNEKIVSSEDIY